MAESPLITNAVARDLIREGRQDETIISAWSEGGDTRTIAGNLGVHESEIANRLRALRPDIWPDESVATLERMWADGCSATQIASELHGVSRSAVLGKVHRMGLPARRAAYPQVPRSKVQSDGDRRLTQTIRRQEKARRQRERALARLRGPALEDEAAPIVTRPQAGYLNIGLLDLERNQCRYSPSKEPPFLFCGQPVTEGSSWCVHCDALVFAPPKPRRERRPWRPTPGMSA